MRTAIVPLMISLCIFMNKSKTIEKVGTRESNQAAVSDLNWITTEDLQSTFQL